MQKLLKRQLQHPVINQTDKTKLFSNRDKPRGRNNSIITLAQTDQTLMQDRLTRSRMHKRLKGQIKTPLVKRGNQLIRQPDVTPPQPLAF